MIYVMKRKQHYRAWTVFSIMTMLLTFVAFQSAYADEGGAVTAFAEEIQDLKMSINLAWTLLCGFLVFNMQAGFALFGAGFLQKENTLNYLTMSFVDFCVGGLIFWAFGFAFMFGGTPRHVAGLDNGNNFIGLSGFFLAGNASHSSTSMLWLFHMMFVVATCTIVTGAVAERFKFHTHLICSMLICGTIYPIYGHWVWGGGWLAKLPFGSGVIDFAGGGVVHGMGGLLAFIGAWMVGPRFGKYNPNGTPNIFIGHNISYIMLGTLFLLFGWFGFNAGSTLAATDHRISIIATNMFLSSISSAITLLYISFIITRKSDVILACNGALAGCVAITASGAYVPHWAAVVIGLVSALILRACLYLIETKLRIDDPVGVISVHGANGLWSMLSVGIFADGSYMGVKGLIVGSGWQLLSQFIGCITLITWTCITGYLIFLLLKNTIGLRVPINEEKSGIDLYEHGISCYSEEESSSFLFGKR